MQPSEMSQPEHAQDQADAPQSINAPMPDPIIITDLLARHNIKLSGDGYIRTRRVLPFKPPLEMVPPCTRKLLERYLACKGDKSMDKAVIRDYRCRLRRYHLIEPDQRRSYATLPDDLRREALNAYRREWSQKKRAKQVAGSSCVMMRDDAR